MIFVFLCHEKGAELDIGCPTNVELLFVGIACARQQARGSR